MAEQDREAEQDYQAEQDGEAEQDRKSCITARQGKAAVGMLAQAV